MKKNRVLSLISCVIIFLSFQITNYTFAEELQTDSTTSTNQINENGGGQAKTDGKISFVTEDENSSDSIEKETKDYFKVLPKTGESKISILFAGLGIFMLGMVLFKRKVGVKK